MKDKLTRVAIKQQILAFSNEEDAKEFFEIMKINNIACALQLHK